METATWLSENITALITLVLGGGLATGVSQLVKAMADSRKTRTEADHLHVSMSAETETVTVATMKEAIQTMRDLAADANASRERAENSERVLQERLSGVEKRNREMCEKVSRLEADDRQKARELGTQRGRITVLERNLSAARAEAHRLATALREVGIDPDPPVDFTIFDI